MLELLQKVFGTANDRALKKLWPQVKQVNAFEERIKKLDDAALRAKTGEFRQKLANGASLEDIRPEAFAVCREAAWRVLGMRHYDVQILGGHVLHSGRIAEMKTGEGKTLVATLPVYLNALSGKGVHLVTVNDYLARRDAEWMGQLYRWLGLSTGVIVNGLSDQERQTAYNSDITYGQNNEFGFDYLRDNMKFDLASYVQRELNYAIIDEVDSILIDEARTPLIISGPSEGDSELYPVVDAIIPKLKKDIHYNIDEKAHSATLTEEGVGEAERLLGVDNLYDPTHIVVLHHVNNALKAHALYRRDVNYLVHEGEVLIIDEHTGRLMPGRRWSDGLHQAVEAKEGVPVQPENQTLATISFQNYFRLYDKLSGMTGTAKTEEGEFQNIYKLDVVVVPTNKPILRDDMADLVYRTEKGKFRACVAEIKERHAKGQPVLVGTTSVEKSEIIHRMLKAEGIEHSVLNAKHHAREAAIVAQAGRLGRVTVATNMAGRGTDIILGGNAEYWGQSLIEDLGHIKRHTGVWEKVEDFVKQIVIGHEDHARQLRADTPALHFIPEEFIEQIAETRDLFKSEQKAVLEAGGLYILGTERHESRRIDNQLRGRAGRQGDPGASRFYLSLEDDLMRIFAGDRMTAIMDRLGMNDDQPIEAGMVSKAIENAQQRVEGQHFDSRKNLLEYDDVMNQQRKTIYGLRRTVLGADEDELRELLLDSVEDLVVHQVNTRCPERTRPEEWDRDGLQNDVLYQFNHQIDLSDLPTARIRYQEAIYFAVEPLYLAKAEKVDRSVSSNFKGSVGEADLAALEASGDKAHIKGVARAVAEQVETREPPAPAEGEEAEAQVGPTELHTTTFTLESDGQVKVSFAAKRPRWLEDGKTVVVEGTVGEDGTFVARTLAKPLFHRLEKDFFLRVIDEQWKDHLTVMDQLRSGIGLRGYGQRDPKKEYQKEGFRLFADLLVDVKSKVVGQLVRLEVRSEEEVRAAEEAHRRQIEAQLRQMQMLGGQQDKTEDGQPRSNPAQSPSPDDILAAPRRRAVGTVRRERPKIGRNDPCWCGSGAKYKKCHMAEDDEAARQQPPA